MGSPSPLELQLRYDSLDQYNAPQVCFPSVVYLLLIFILKKMENGEKNHATFVFFGSEICILNF
jgi:hypothetical protein